MALVEFASIVGFDRVLGGWEECADRIVDEIQLAGRSGRAITQIVESSDRLDRLIEYSLPALRVGAVGEEVGQARNHFHIVPRQELDEIGLRREQQDRQVAAINHMPAESLTLLNHPTETWVQLGRASGDVDSGDVRYANRPHTKFGYIALHDFATVGTGVNVAMFAGLVAELPHINLKHRNGCCGKWRMSCSCNSFREWLPLCMTFEQHALLFGRRKRMLNADQTHMLTFAAALRICSPWTREAPPRMADAT